MKKFIEELKINTEMAKEQFTTVEQRIFNTGVNVGFQVVMDALLDFSLDEINNQNQTPSCVDFMNWFVENVESYKNYNVDQLTFRKIYKSGNGKEANWVGEHEYPEAKFKTIIDYVCDKGVTIARLPYGFIQYSVDGISTVVDTNCMSKNNIDEMKYAILRPNGHLYSRWDDKGSLIF